MLFMTQSSAALRGMLIAVLAMALFGFCLTSSASADPDITPPVVTITGYPANNDTAGTFIFSADEPVLGYECQVDGQITDPWVACSVPVFVVGLGQGAHEFRVRATDLASNVSDPPTTYSWVIDTEPPATPVISVPTSGTWTNDDQPTISGTAEPLVSVRVFDGSDLLGTTTANGGGSWSFTPASPLIDGSYSIRVRARDAATNESATSVARALYIDTVAPAAPTITDPNEGELTNATDLVFAGATEPFATVAVSVDAQSPDVVTASSAGQWSFDPSLPPIDGVHSATATSTDRAGNVGATSASVNFELESDVPAQPAITNPTTGTIQADDSVTFAGTAEALAAVTLIDGSSELASAVADGSGNWTANADLADGTYSVVAIATDAYGNESPPSTAVALTIDTTGPTITITAGPPEFSNQTDATFEFESNEPSTDFECSFDMTYWAACASLDTFSGRPEGANEFAVRGTDALGNIGAPSEPYEWTVDLDAPAAPTIVSPASPMLSADVRTVIAGTAEPHASVELMIASSAQTGSLGTVTADGTTGEWEFAPDADLPQGALQFTAVATDRAENVGAASATLELSIDSIAPVTSFAAPTGQDRSRSISFAANEAGVAFSCGLDGGPAAPCVSPFVAADLSYGVHTFAVRATDVAGNVEAPAKSLQLRVAMIDNPFGLDPRCSFERISPGEGVTVSRLQLGAVVRRRQIIRFSADRPGITRVAMVRRGRELAQVSIVVKKGRNVARLPIKRGLASGSTAELVISSLSETAARTVLGRRVVLDNRGKARANDKKFRVKRSNCAKPKGARATKLRVLSSRRTADTLTVRVRSSDLALATLRVSDEFSYAQAGAIIIKAGRIGEISLKLPPGLGGNPAGTRIVLTAFNTEYARAKADLAFPTG